MTKLELNPKEMTNDALREYLLLLVQHVRTYNEVPFYALGILKEVAERMT